VFCVSGIPNWRNASHIVAAKLLREAEARGLASAGAIRTAVEEAPTGIDPESLWAIADELPYAIELRWTDLGAPGSFDAVFTRADNGATLPRVPWRARATEVGNDAWWIRHANEPARKHAARKLTDQLRDQLKQRLPAYMVPSSFTVVDTLPLTHNGKVDVVALAALDDGPGREAATEIVAPRSPVEQRVASVWCEVLGLDRVGVHHNFFELGGHSLLGIQIIVRLRELLDLSELSLSSLFSTPTVASLSEKIEAMQYQHASVATAPKGEREEMAF
jgi:acyl carrier protein